MKKRIIVLALILAIVFSMTACSSVLGSVLSKNNKENKKNEFSQMMDDLKDLEDALADLEDMPVPEVTMPPIEMPEIEIPEIEIPEIEIPAEDWFPTASYELEDYIYGTWQRETMYLEFYGCDADMYTTFLKGGRATQVLLRHDNGKVLNESAGDWTFEGDEVVLVKDGADGRIRFSYNESTHKLKNGEKYYTKISD